MSTDQESHLDMQLGRVDKLLSTARIILAAVVSLVMCAFALGVAVRSNAAEIDALKVRVSAIELDRAQRIPEYQHQMDTVQRGVDKLGNDVDWIKAALQRKER